MMMAPAQGGAGTTLAKSVGEGEAIQVVDDGGADGLGSRGPMRLSTRSV